MSVDAELRKMEKFVVRVFSIFIFIALCVMGCSYLNQKFGLQDDNPIEEGVEESIEDEFGIRIDLTPKSIE